VAKLIQLIEFYGFLLKSIDIKAKNKTPGKLIAGCFSINYKQNSTISK